MSVQIIQGDCIEVMRGMDAGSAYWSRSKLREIVPALDAFDHQYGNKSVVEAIVDRLNTIVDAMRDAGYEPDQVDTRAPIPVQDLKQHVAVLLGSTARTAAGLRALHRGYKRADKSEFKDRIHRDLKALAYVLRAKPGEHGGPHGGCDCLFPGTRSRKKKASPSRKRIADDGPKAVGASSRRREGGRLKCRNAETQKRRNAETRRDKEALK